MMRCDVCGVVAMALGGLIALELTQPLSKGEERKDGMGKIPKHVKDTLEWLPVETETVYVANGPFKLPRVKGERDAAWEARWIPMFLLDLIRKGRYWSLLEGREVLACVEGSCRFRHPKGLGPYFFDGCQVVLLKEALEKGGATFMDRLLDEANGSEVVKGLEVARFEEQLEGGDWKFYVVLIKGKVLLMATSRPYLAGVISRMQGGKGPVFGRGRKEWKHVDGTADAWAIRRLEREGDEPKGLVVSYYEKAATGRVRYVTSDGGISVANAREAWRLLPPLSKKPRGREISPGVVEISHRLKDQATVSSFLWLVHWRLGHWANY